MKRHIPILIALLVVPLLASCSRRDLSERVETTATLTLECAEAIDIPATRMMLFDKEGYYLSDIEADGQSPATFQVLSGIHTVAVYANAADYDFNPASPAEGSTHISTIQVSPKADAPENPYFWFGHATAHIHPDLQTSLTVELTQAAAISIGITVNPWNQHNTDVTLTY